MLLQGMAQRIEHWALQRLIPYTRNPRTHSGAQVAQIAASIAEFGFNNPILVDTKAGIIKMRANLSQRLKRLEARVKPTDEPEEFVIEFVGPGKEVVRTLVIRPGAPASPISPHQ